jgi:hypothetical protein
MTCTIHDIQHYLSQIYENCLLTLSFLDPTAFLKTLLSIYLNTFFEVKVKVTAIPLQAWTGP